MDVKKGKIGGLLLKEKKERFDNLVKNALRRHNFSIVNKLSETHFEIASGTASFTADVKDIKTLYDQAGTEREMESLTAMLESAFITESKMISFTNAQTLLRFLVMREDEVKENYISGDFVGNLKKVVVYTADDVNLNFLDESYTRKWGVPREVLFSVADRNMCKLLEKAEIKESNLNEVVRALEFSLPGSELCVSMIMCNDFRKTVHKYFGAKFLVAAPSRENLIALENVTNDILEGLGAAIINEHRKSAYPLTTDILLFTQDDVETVGHFSVDRS